MLCHFPMCHGAGWIFVARNGSREWWPCPICGGAGVSVQHGPAEIKTGVKR